MARGRPAECSFIARNHSRDLLKRRLDGACQQARITPHRPKDFRDTFATLLILNGIALKFVSRQLATRASR